MPAGLSRALPWAWTVAEWEGMVRPRGLKVPFLPKCPLGVVGGAGDGAEAKEMVLGTWKVSQSPRRGWQAGMSASLFRIIVRPELRV